ncbi:hypothetical protein AB0I22_19785 [Streptomyces sp. NPDC050610]|uniref:hypothetical protein n=1 Tax=Streptomyces sp. NPDC050610 TaxID=3157097 RepID=UPI00342C3DBB
MGYPSAAPAVGTDLSGGLDLQGLSAVLALISEAGNIEALQRRLDQIHVGYTEAARRLNIPEKWLRERIGSLPHRKMGKFVGFSEDDLRAISDMHAVRPALDATRTEKLPVLVPSSRSRSRA